MAPLVHPILSALSSRACTKVLTARFTIWKLRVRSYHFKHIGLVIATWRVYNEWNNIYYCHWMYIPMKINGKSNHYHRKPSTDGMSWVKPMLTMLTYWSPYEKPCLNVSYDTHARERYGCHSIAKVSLIVFMTRLGNILFVVIIANWSRFARWHNW
jgi:hypothetical protein